MALVTGLVGCKPQTPEKASAVAVAAPAAVPASREPVSPVVPAALQGTWTPLSRALEPLRAMTLSANAISWSPCQGSAIRPVSTSASGIVLALQDARCELDGVRLTHMAVQPRAGSCDAELSLFGSDDAYAQKTPQAWGLVTLNACKPTSAASAAGQ